MNTLERPPALLPNGKRNKDYTRWYRQMNPDSVKDYNCSDKGKACAKRHYAKHKTAMHEQNKVTYCDECKCVVCEMVFKKVDAILRGFRFQRYAGNLGVCEECL
jgi:hypothetical protein